MQQLGAGGMNFVLSLILFNKLLSGTCMFGTVAVIITIKDFFLNSMTFQLL